MARAGKAVRQSAAGGGRGRRPHWRSRLNAGAHRVHRVDMDAPYGAPMHQPHHLRKPMPPPLLLLEAGIHMLMPHAKRVVRAEAKQGVCPVQAPLPLAMLSHHCAAAGAAPHAPAAPIPVPRGGVGGAAASWPAADVQPSAAATPSLTPPPRRPAGLQTAPSAASGGEPQAGPQQAC